MLDDNEQSHFSITKQHKIRQNHVLHFHISCQDVTRHLYHIKLFLFIYFYLLYIL